MSLPHRKTDRVLESGVEDLQKQQVHEHDPISYLFPAEISSRIFLFVASQPDEAHEKPWQALVLASVSHRWREIATSEPRLWTSIILTLDGGPPPLPHPDTLGEFLRRSGQLPLSIYVRSLLEEEITIALFRPLCDVLSGCADRWASLDISGPLHLVSLFHAKYEGRSILNSIFITPEGIDHESRSAARFDLGEMVPGPRFITTIGMPLPSVRVNLDNVDFLTMHSLHIDECVEILRRSPKLQRCNFSFIQPGSAAIRIPEERLWLPKLKSLVLFNLGRHRSESARLFDYITAPSLETLSASAENDADMITLFSFLSRSSPTLKSLTFWGAPTEEALIRLLRKLPTLQSLDIFNVDISNVFFDLLASTTNLLSGPQFLPSLISLRLKISKPITFSWRSVAGIFGALADEIEVDRAGSRQRPLSKLKMRLGDDEDDEDDGVNNITIEEDVVRLFLAYRAAGISIEITDPDSDLDFILAD